MIQGEAAIFLNLLSITAFSALLIIAALAIWLKLNGRFLNDYSASSRRSILWIVALSPWVLGLVAAILAVGSGTQYFPVPTTFDLLHWHHPREFLLVSWHGITTVIAVSCASFLLARSISRLSVNNRQIKLLRELAEVDEHGIYQLDADTPAAFTAGYSHPRCYITSALRKQLSNDEYSIIQLHEKEHAKRFDPLKKWGFQLLTSFYPQNTGRQLNRSMTMAVEQCADSAVARVFADKSFIASTLLRVRRLTNSPIENTMDSNAACHYALDDIEGRISYLLADQQGKEFPFVAAVLTATFMSITCALSADIFHHVIEFTLSH